jgi:DNA-binding NarL/FixJ family response regulator
MSIAVAIVEDDAETRKILSGWLKLASRFRLVGEWGDPLKAVDLLPETKPEVVLVDINLQVSSGIELVRQLKPILPKTQFLMVTVYQDADHIYEALAAGATGYLLKQTSMDELTEAIEDIHAGGSPMTSVIARKVTQAFAKPRPGLPADVKLSAREQDVLDLLARGFSLKEVADKLEIRMPSVKTYVRRMYEKLHVCSRTQAVAKYAHLEAGQASSKPRLG